MPIADHRHVLLSDVCSCWLLQQIAIGCSVRWHSNVADAELLIEQLQQRCSFVHTSNSVSHHPVTSRHSMMRVVERRVTELSRCRLLDNSKVRVVNNSTSRHLGSTNVELFQNSTKMQNYDGQPSRRNRATFAFNLHSSTNVELYENWKKMQNSRGQLSQRNRATLAFVPTPRTFRN